MKQKLLNKQWLRICMIVAVMTAALTGTAWAEEVTFDLTAETTATSFVEGAITATFNKANGSTEPKWYSTGTAMRLYGKGTLTISGGTNTITKIVVYTPTSSNNMTSSNSSVDVGTLTVASGVGTWTGSASTVVFSNTASSGHWRVSQIKVTYSAGSSSAVSTTTTIDYSNITNTDVYTDVAAGSLTATVNTVDGDPVTGATVTWSSSNEAVATIDANGAVTLVAPGTVTFTAVYAGVQDEYIASSDTYEMTVTSSAPYVQPTEFDVALNNTLFGTKYTGSVSGLTDANPISGTLNGVTVTYAGSGNHYINDSQIRFYPNNKLTFEAPADYVITKIVFTSAGTWTATVNSEEGTYTSDTKTWEGEAATVLFTGSGSGRCDMSKVAITLKAVVPKVLASIEVSGDYPTSFHAGDAFSHEGIVVTATYDDSTTRDVTASATFSEPDMTTVGVKTVTVSYSEGEVTKTATYDITVNAPATLTSIALSGTYPTEFQQGDAFSSEGIVVTAYYDDNTTANVTAEATFSGYDMNALGEQTVTVSYEGKDATYTINVVEKKGTATNPYTVAQARAAIDAGTGTQGVYATGIVSKIVTAYNSQFGNISYNISADGTETADQLQAYRGFSYNGDWFTSEDDIKVGDVVVVYGNLKKYNSTYEFDAGNQLVSLVRPVVTTPSINLGDNIINAFAQGTDGVIIVGYENITNVAADVFFCDADGNAATYDWLTASINSINNLEYVINENTSTDARTAYMKVHALDDDANDVYSELITINQAGYVAPVEEFATLPFSFDGGKADIESTDGLTQDGLGTDYKNSPYLKFDGTGDYVVLAFDERPGVLTFNIQGNSFSGGTFQVQASEDGVEYGTVATYTELGSVETKTISDLGEDIRYIKWVYTEKVSGNVALGNIVVHKYSADPAIRISSNTVNVGAVAANNALMTDGTLDITLENITISDMDQFEVKYLTSSLESTTKPEWLDVIVAEQDPSIGTGYVVSYTVLDNDGDARSAYFQVYGRDDDGSTEALSQVITIEQAAYVAPATGDQYALFTGNLVEGDYIIYYDGYAMNTDVENGRLMYAEVTPESDVITTSNAAIVWHIAKSGDYWTLYNAEADAYAASTGVKNKAQMLADGTDDMALWEVSDEYEFVNKKNSDAGVNAYLRNNGTYGFACYAATTGGALSLYKKVGDAPVPTSQTVTVSAAGYATMVAAQDLEIPAGVEVFAVEIRGEWAHLEPVTTGIPAGEAVVVRADEGEYVFDYAAETVEALTVTNDLIAATEPVITDGRQYVLAKPGNEEVGFYKAAGTIAAGKAYLQISGEAPVKGFTFIFDDDDATGIEMVNGQSSMVNDPIFNLAGQRIQKLQRGINIVGGKKMLK